MKESSAKELIRIAEQHLAKNNYLDALAALDNARSVDRDNPYIQAVVDRVHAKLREVPSGSSPFDKHRIPSGPSADRYLSVTVGSQFQDGIKITTPDANLSPRAIQQQVKNLTNIASHFLARGSVDSAFESLMQAYLLDPVNPDVLACEEKVLPAWKKLHKHKTPSKQQASDAARGNASKSNPAPPFSIPSNISNPMGTTSSVQEWKSGVLRQKKMMLENEQSGWDANASKLEEFTKNKIDHLGAEKNLEKKLPKTSGPEKGFFAKVKKGKLLG